MGSPESIRLRGVRQNNLKGFDLDLPLGKYVVVTGLSGAGKSSLVFETLHAEGQRRYVETFSAYTRQFLELLAKPKVDSIENIRPSIAIEQTNTVKTSRSTVGTMTELTDYFKVWFSHVAACFDPVTGEKVEDDNAQTIWAKAAEQFPSATLLVAFRVTRPENLEWREILSSLQTQSYQRVLLPPAKSDAASGELRRIDELLADLKPLKSASTLFVVQDRIAIEVESRPRFIEAVEAALHFGKGEVHLFGAADGSATPAPAQSQRATARAAAESAGTSSLPPPRSSFFQELGHYSRGLHSPKTGRRFRPATPALFSFNSPLGACPKCRGFGRIIDIDYRLAIPDRSLSIDQGAIKCWEGEIYGESKRDLLQFTKKKKIRTDVPFAELPEEQQQWIIEGEPGYGENGVEWPKAWYGLKGFFRYLEKTTYKMHVRVFLSRYRAYNLCPVCHGTRLQPEALCWKWNGRTLPELYQIAVGDLLNLLAEKSPAETRTTDDAAAAVATHSSDIAFDAIRSRLRYLAQVGLGYLTLDRQSRTLSGGEVERVNLTSCLGSSLVDTLFVLDEPSVGLHPRDIDRLIAIVRSLTDAGNTVVVVEHDEAMIRAADHVLEIGPEPGAAGGHVVFQGTVPQLLRSPKAITGDYLSGRRSIPVPAQRRVVRPKEAHLEFRGVAKHNLRGIDFRIPLKRFVCLSGVSGSGKSTLLDHAIYQGLLASRRLFAEDAATITSLRGAEQLGDIVLVDQSPLSRTPRSNPALYAEAWEHVRDLFASTETAREAGYNASSFSFNGGDGRCDHCSGLGFEQVEMQFLSDVYVPCPICEGKRFKPEILACTWNGRSVADVLAMTVNDAIGFFASAPVISRRLAPLAEVGLGYLALGQPLNTLSGGEAQRLKLVKYLGAFAGGEGAESREPRAEKQPEGKEAGGQKPGATEANNGADSANAKPKTPNAKPALPPQPATVNRKPETPGALLLLDEPTTGLHRHDVSRLLGVLQRLVDVGHTLVVIEHNTDVLKSADWILEVGPEAGANGGQIIAAGTPEDIAKTKSETAAYLRAALTESEGRGARGVETIQPNSDSALLVAEDPATYGDRPSNQDSPLSAPRSQPSSAQAIEIVGARENNLRNLSLTIPHHEFTVVTGVSGSGKSTLAFDIVFAEGQRRFMESMSPYARQFVEQLPRPAIDKLTGIPPTVAIEQRVTRGSRKSTVATITEVAQYLRLLYAKLGVQHHPVSGRPIQALSLDELRDHFRSTLQTPAAKKAKHLYLCAPLVRGRKGHHQPIADWIRSKGYKLMRADGRLTLVENFTKLDRFKEHDVEVVVADLKNPEARGQKPGAESRKSAASSTKTGQSKDAAKSSATVSETGIRPLASGFSASDAFLEEALKLGKGSCFLLTPDGAVLSWFSTTRTDAETGEAFPELDPKDFSFNSPKGWCPVCRGHGVIAPWMLKPDDDEDETPPEIAELAHLFADGEGSHTDHPTCPECGGSRLKKVARAVKLHFRKQEPLSLPQLIAATPSQLIATLRDLKLDTRGRLIVQDIIPQIEERLKFMDEVGLAYLALDRATNTLSGGEAQRIRLAAQLGSNLSGVLYVLDEPSIGLHSRDNDRLIATLKALRAKGNSLLVVEHDDVVMENADRIIDLGPGAGRHGGQLLANDSPAEIKKQRHSLTGLYLGKGIPHPIRGAYRNVEENSKGQPPKAKTAGAAATTAGKRKAQNAKLEPPAAAAPAGLRPETFNEKPETDSAPPTGWLELTGAQLRNLRKVDLRLPLGRLIMVAGPSGAGQSTLFRDLLGPAVTQAIKSGKSKYTGKDYAKATGAGSASSSSSAATATPFTELHGANDFKSVIEVDQSPIGYTPRSTPATYLGIFDLVRNFFATIPEAKIRGYTAGRFSFNTAGGRCETCAGAGRVKLEMSFMPDTFVTCDSCNGRRYGPDVLEIQWKGKNVADLLEMTFDEARVFFDFHAQLKEVCALMCETGLGYLTLGQSSPTLSGGEAQRLKLVTELARGLQSFKERSRGLQPRNLYLLEEPTIGLHLSDCEKLIHLLQRLAGQGHTVAVIEHHLDLLAEADWLVELGPSGGPDGGEILYQGPVAGIAKVKRSPTAPYLREKLKLA